MKIILGAALGALLLSAPVMAQAQSHPAGQSSQAEPMIGVFSQSPIAGEDSRDGQTPGVPVVGVVSTPYTYGSGDSQATPRFDYRGAVRVDQGVAVPGNGDPALPDSTMGLVNQTGGGR